ncbi:hypothetical protein [Oryzobacter telluris]|uniref:hypothetical protein n=1 Tax=Oryzobacter telluris TaxID=3149179 RepID=UPI00370D18A7
MGLPDEDRPIRYPSVLSVLGREHREQWTEKAGDGVTRVDNSLAERSTFGGTPAAQKFASVYEAARTEYEAVLKGAREDLRIAAENLALAAQEMRSRDENAGAAFVTLLSRWTDPNGFESTQRQEEARGTEQGQQGATTMADLTEDDQPPAGDRPDPSGGPVTGPGAGPGSSPGAEPAPTMATGPTGTGPSPGRDGVA